MDNTEITPAPTAITPDTIATNDSIPHSSTPEIPDNYQSGGILQKINDFKIVEYFTFALIIAASIYSIAYHRQALNKLNDTYDT